MQTIFGNYSIERELKSGGMGRVLLGRQLSLQRPVAIKELFSDLADNPHFIARFEKEAIGLGTMACENIVGALDFGREGASYFIVMEYVDGGDLSSLLSDRFCLDANQALTIFEQAARGLSYAHRKAILHRDIKPANIMISSDGFAKVTDFGLCRFADDHTELTLSGAVMGTPRYMSPEQSRGLPLDERSDIYSLGLVLYEMLTGLFAVEGENVDEIDRNRLEGKVADTSRIPRRIPRQIVKLLNGTVEREPGKRFSGFGEILKEIRLIRRKVKELHEPADIGLLTGRKSEDVDLKERIEAIRATMDTRAHSQMATTVSHFEIEGYVPGYRPFYREPLELNQLLDRIGNGGSVLIKGRPGSGKTRLAAEAVTRLKGWNIIVLDPREDVSFEVGQRNIVLWEDIDSFKWNPAETIADIKIKSEMMSIIGTLRSGTALSQVEKLHPDWMYIFDARMELGDISDNDALAIASETGGDIDLFDGTPGSIVHDLTAVRALYRALPDKEILHALKAFWLLNRKSVKRDELALMLSEIFGRDLPKPDLRKSLKSLAADSLIKNLDGSYSIHYDIYASRVITDFEAVDLEEEMVDIAEVFEDNLNMRTAIAAWYWSKGDNAGMLRIARGNYKRWPENTYVESQLAVALRNTGHIEEAMDMIERAVAHDDQNYDLYINRGTIRTTAGDYQGAIDDYNLILRMRPDDIAALNNRAIVWKMMGQRQKALADYNRAIELRPDLPELWNNRAVERFITGDREGAIADFNHAIEVNPSYSKAYTNRGLIYRMLGKHDMAERDFIKAVKIDPADAQARYNHAHVMKGKPDYTQALMDYSMAFELQFKKNEKAKALSACAIIYAITGQRQKAERTLTEAEGIDPDASLYNGLCTYSALLPEYPDVREEALERLRAVLDRGNTSADWMRNDPDLEHIRALPEFGEILDQE